MRAATVALIIKFEQEAPTLMEVLSDDREIRLLESCFGEWQEADKDPLEEVYEARAQRVKEDEEFSDYVEELLSQPFVRPEIQEHGVQWLKSKIRIDQYQKDELEAARIIAGYAYQVYQEDTSKTDFLLAGPSTQVRVRVFVVSDASTQSRARMKSA